VLAVSLQHERGGTVVCKHLSHRVGCLAGALAEPLCVNRQGLWRPRGAFVHTA
jgi:hypothetical protein